MCVCIYMLETRVCSTCMPLSTSTSEPYLACEAAALVGGWHPVAPDHASIQDTLCLPTYLPTKLATLPYLPTNLITHLPTYPTYHREPYLACEAAAALVGGWQPVAADHTSFQKGSTPWKALRLM